METECISCGDKVLLDDKGRSMVLCLAEGDIHVCYYCICYFKDILKEKQELARS